MTRLNLRVNIIGNIVVLGSGIVGLLWEFPEFLRHRPVDTAGMILNTVFSLVLFLWIIVQVESNRLDYYFTDRYPEVAAKEFPEYGPPGRLLYFLRNRSAALIQQDEQLRRIKRRIIVCFKISLALPLSFFLLIVLGIIFGVLN